MQINITLGKPKKDPLQRPAGEGENEGVDLVDKVKTTLSKRNMVIFTAGIAIGIIVKQRAEINMLRRTLDVVTDVIHG